MQQQTSGGEGLSLLDNDTRKCVNHDGGGSARSGTASRFPRGKTRWRGKGEAMNTAEKVLNISQGYFGHCITQMMVHCSTRVQEETAIFMTLNGNSWMWSD